MRSPCKISKEVRVWNIQFKFAQLLVVVLPGEMQLQADISAKAKNKEKAEVLK
jgi:hypothetical protein